MIEIEIPTDKSMERSFSRMVYLPSVTVNVKAIREALQSGRRVNLLLSPKLISSIFSLSNWKSIKKILLDLPRGFDSWPQHDCNHNLKWCMPKRLTIWFNRWFQWKWPCDHIDVSMKSNDSLQLLWVHKMMKLLNFSLFRTIKRLLCLYHFL